MGDTYKHLGDDRLRLFLGSGQRAEISADPIAFALRMGFEPDEQQALVLRSKAKQGILNCTRQWGKSTTAAALAVFHAVHTRGALVVVASPSEKQSAELVRKAAGMMGKLGVKTRKDGIHPISMVLPNGSRIVGVPGNDATVRGLSRVTLLLVDEAARVPDEMYNAVRPMLATCEGTVWLMSTPWATFGFFYEAWAHGGEEWERVCVPATACPRISAEWLEKERRHLGEMAFRREYMTEFAQSDEAAFEASLVQEALDQHVAAIDVDWLLFRRERKP